MNNSPSESHSDEERPDPEDDPFRCSICGAPLGEVDRVEGRDYCRGCRSEHGVPEDPEGWS